LPHLRQQSIFDPRLLNLYQNSSICLASISALMFLLKIKEAR